MNNQTRARRLLIILGAGASQPVVPLARCLLPVVINRMYPVPTDEPASPEYGQKYRFVLKELWQRYGQPENFERVLDLALTEAEKSETWLTAAHQAAQRVAIKIVESLRANSEFSSAPLMALLGRANVLADSMTVASLNWDDLPLQVPDITWHDGFSHDSNNPQPFDVEFLNNRKPHEPQLFWLHGSIHLNRHLEIPLTHSSPTGFRWENDPLDALHRWVIGSNPEGARTSFDLPIVTGGQKPEQISRTPFDKYWSALAVELRRATTLAIIGYAGQDPHLNKLQKEIADNTNLRQAVWVGWDVPPYQTPIDKGLGAPVGRGVRISAISAEFAMERNGYVSRIGSC